jgi:prepilin-type N-terminal cleavage/methylation domain-containing protein
MRKIRNNKGFTLIELMIVVVIIGILAALAIPRFSKASDRAKEKEADGVLKQIYTLQQTYYAQHGDWAGSVSDLETVGFEAPTTLKNYSWDGDNSIAQPAPCLGKSPTTATHSNRQIDLTSGEITDAASC